MAQTRLKQLREEAVLTVHELAEASGVSDDTISKIENGQRVARPSTLRKLAVALDVSPQELRRPAKVEEPVPLAKAPREAGRRPKTVTSGAHLTGGGTLHAEGKVIHIASEELQAIIRGASRGELSEEEAMAEIYAAGERHS